MGESVKVIISIVKQISMWEYSMGVCMCVFSCVFFSFFPPMLVWIAGRDVCPLPIAAPEEPSWLCVHHQNFTHPQLQK